MIPTGAAEIMGNKTNRIGLIIRHTLGRLLSDKSYISHDFKRVFGKKPDLENPVTYSEKLQWLKLYDRKPLYKTLADKIAVRDYISKNYGSRYLFPLHGVYDSYDDIDFNVLPNKFVLKPSHASGHIFFCENKDEIDHRALRKTVNRWLRTDYYYEHREWQYKGIQRKLLCEKYMVDSEYGVPRNYKFFCFNGEPKVLLVTTGNGPNRPQNYFDLDFNALDICSDRRNIEKLEKPENFDEMLFLVRKIVKPFLHVRMDMYIISGKIYIGEFTFHHYSGVKKWHPESADLELGAMLELPI